MNLAAGKRRAVKSTPYFAYLLRFWREPGSGWRFSLQDPHSGARRGFATLEELVAFLERQMENGKLENSRSIKRAAK